MTDTAHHVLISEGSGFTLRQALQNFDSYQDALQAVLDHAVAQDGQLIVKSALRDDVVHAWTLTPGPAADDKTGRKQTISLRKGKQS